MPTMTTDTKTRKNPTDPDAAYWCGVDAFYRGVHRGENPYAPGSDAADYWDAGWAETQETLED